jgi:hypothetical protein
MPSGGFSQWLKKQPVKMLLLALVRITSDVAPDLARHLPCVRQEAAHIKITR